MIKQNKIFTFLLLFLFVMSIGCSSTSKMKGSVSGEMYKDSNEEYASDEMDYAPSVAPKEMSRSEKKRSVASKPASNKGGKVQAVESEPANEVAKTRMVVYRALYDMTVENVKQGVEKLDKLCRQEGGFTESSNSSDSWRAAVIVLRVPVVSFDKVLLGMEKFGEVTHKEISASDVTAEFTDISLRLDAARKIRERLVDLLKRTEKIKDKVEILKEIERLDSQIETMTAQMKYLQSQADYSTITVTLRAKVQENVSHYIPSPFSWIAGLSADNRSIFDKIKSFDVASPAGFFDFSKKYYKDNLEYIYKSADDDVAVRIGEIENYPSADLTFWNEALSLDFTNRFYRLIDSSKISGSLEFRSISVNSFAGIYQVAIAVKGDRLVVVEVVYASEEVYAKNKERVESLIKGVKSK